MNKRVLGVVALRKLTRPAKSAVLALATAAGSAMAAVPEAVSTELGTAKTDVMTVGALVFAVAVGVVIFKWFRRAL